MMVLYLISAERSPPGSNLTRSSSGTGAPTVPVVASTSRVATGAHAENVTLLPVPEDVKDARLVQELRAMVVGETVLNEGQKA
jgi:hypothetical protein